MTDLLLRMLSGATLGLALVLLLRRPVRHVFGAGPAFTLWLLPLVLMLAPLLPPQLAPAAMVVLPGWTVTPHVAAVAASRSNSIDLTRWLVVSWAFGAAIVLIRLAVHYLRMRRDARTAPSAWTGMLGQAVPNLDMRRVRVHAAGPALLCSLPRSLILLPADFAQRFANVATRELVLRHELTHARRGDAWWSLAMEVVSALLWFHPLMWLARPSFRLDQELACDAAALRALPQRNVHYVHALLDGVAVQPVPVLIPWLAEPQLKERIAMIAKMPPGALRRRFGFVAIGALLAGSLYIVGGQMPAEAAAQNSKAPTPPQVNVTYKHRHPPRYPINSLHNGKQGTVMLRVQVDAHGNVTNVDVDKAKTTATSAELQAAAVTAAEHWKFNPGEKDGKPSGGWISIPVTFSLTPIGACPAGQGHSSHSPFKCVPLQPVTKSS
jgi:TonB family protein